MIDFSIPPEMEATQQRVTTFMDQHVYPNENKLVEDEGLPDDLERELQNLVKAQGLWAPNFPPEWGGMGIGYIGQALVNEIIGRSVIGPRPATPHRMLVMQSCCSLRLLRNRRSNTFVRLPRAKYAHVLR